MALSYTGTYTKGFNLHSGSGSTNWRGYALSGTQAMSQLYPVPNVPAANRGQNNQPKLVIVALGLDIGGYNDTSTFRYRIWSSGGTNLYYSSVLPLDNEGSAIDLPRITLDIPSGTNNAGDGETVDLSLPPVLTTNTTAGGTTNFRFGATDYGNFGFQKQVNTAYNVDRDGSSGYNTAFSTTSTDTDFTLIGAVKYMWLPSAPGTVSVTAGVRQLSVSWGASDDGGDGSYLSYTVEVATDSGFSNVVATKNTASTSTTVTGLSNGTTYYTRVFATNLASDYIGDASPYTVASGSETTTPLPNWDTGDTSIEELVVINTLYSDYGNYEVLATNATSYSVSSGSLPTGMSSVYNPLTGGLVLYGTPTAVGVFNFTLSAANVAGTDLQNFTIEVMGGAQVWNPTLGKWVKGTTKVWNGSAWVPAVVNIRTGGAWKALG